ncbi:PilZ domain-containing protein [Sphingomicrobium astaxanthinifaciens]|uniref:PilZ domain-containing protein n=1 Tax=Sphingomicrobium astaxanthinifaciens TaxID=1227949 RepID=UPI001FCABD62|nr:PilZ domain-containing protein [Sphingomicrobium astaxanthinifaciens]MCJ7420351.1 PilZ domain-containing protein [Sphingomicrobium astaxanthinifaciens]
MPLNSENVVKIAQSESTERKDERVNLFLSALLESAGERLSVIVRNISPTGALIEAPGLPAVGSHVRLVRAQNQVSGVIVWQSRGRCGINFDIPILPTDWSPNSKGSGQSQVDCKVASARQSNLYSIQEDKKKNISDIRVAEEIDYTIRSISFSLDELAEYPILLNRAPATLQRLEKATNALMHLSKILKSDDRFKALDDVGMADLVRRLTR